MTARLPVPTAGRPRSREQTGRGGMPATVFPG